MVLPGTSCSSRVGSQRRTSSFISPRRLGRIHSKLIAGVARQSSRLSPRTWPTGTRSEWWLTIRNRPFKDYLGHDRDAPSGRVHSFAVDCGCGEYRSDDGFAAGLAESWGYFAGALVWFFEPRAAVAAAWHPADFGRLSLARSAATRRREWTCSHTGRRSGALAHVARSQGDSVNRASRDFRGRAAAAGPRAKRVRCA